MPQPPLPALPPPSSRRAAGSYGPRAAGRRNRSPPEERGRRGWREVGDRGWRVEARDRAGRRREGAAARPPPPRPPPPTRPGSASVPLPGAPPALAAMPGPRRP
ncbi:actin nucleation-promoting factor WAS-like [Ovis aries]|uniref:actin nucleation-promoting factor WAS-like n=1 Tax=Ovis aries TaxID=9940 RepID=UPI001C2EFE43|nr:actin nucleation-promoting factor WAS-like [Ovis aries]